MTEWRAVISRVAEIADSLLTVYVFTDATTEDEITAWFEMRIRESAELVDLVGAI